MRNPYAETWIPRLEVLIDFVSGLRKKEIFGENLANLVQAWGKEWKLLSSKFLREVKLLVWPVARKYRGEGGEVETLGPAGGTEAVRWMFHRDIMEELTLHTKGKLRIEVFASLMPSCQ